MDLVIKANKVKKNTRDDKGEVKSEMIDLPLVGHVKIKILTYKEQIQLGKALKYDLGPDGALKEKGDLDMAIAILDAVEKYVSEVSVKRKDNGFEFKDFETLSMDKDGRLLIDHLGGVLTDGAKLGE